MATNTTPVCMDIAPLRIHLRICTITTITTTVDTTQVKSARVHAEHRDSSFLCSFPFMSFCFTVSFTFTLCFFTSFLNSSYFLLTCPFSLFFSISIHFLFPCFSSFFLSLFGIIICFSLFYSPSLHFTFFQLFFLNVVSHLFLFFF